MSSLFLYLRQGSTWHSSVSKWSPVQACSMEQFRPRAFIPWPQVCEQADHSAQGCHSGHFPRKQTFVSDLFPSGHGGELSSPSVVQVLVLEDVPRPHVSEHVSHGDHSRQDGHCRSLWQSFTSMKSPSPQSPSFSWFWHIRARVVVPNPHEAEQSFHKDHCDQEGQSRSVAANFASVFSPWQYWPSGHFRFLVTIPEPHVTAGSLHSDQVDHCEPHFVLISVLSHSFVRVEGPIHEPWPGRPSRQALNAVWSFWSQAQSLHPDHKYQFAVWWGFRVRMGLELEQEDLKHCLLLPSQQQPPWVHVLWL